MVLPTQRSQASDQKQASVSAARRASNYRKASAHAHRGHRTMSRISKSDRYRQIAGHLGAIQRAVAATLQKLRGEIEDCHKRGVNPADYSLGFTNAMVMADHHLSMRQGEPEFYDHRTTIGKLPMPVKFTHEMIEEEAARAEFDAQMGQIIVAAKELLTVLAPYEMTHCAEQASKLDGMLQAFYKKETHEG